MARPKRTQAQALEDYALIEVLSHRGSLSKKGGMTQKEIAKEISKIRDYTVTQQTISNDMVKLREIWKASAAVEIDIEKGKLKSHYEYLISEAYKAWDRSQEDDVVITTGTTPKGHIDTVQRRGQAGDSKFLAEIRALLSEYKALFGLDAPKRSELTGAGGKDLPNAVNVYLPNNDRESNA